MNASAPPSSSEESAWIARARNGDRAASALLYRMHAARLHRTVLAPRLRDAAAAEDALAETFRSAFAKLESYEDRGDGLFPWLAVIARHEAHDALRARGRSERAIGRLESLLAPVTESGPLADVAIDRERLRESVRHTLSEITPRYREAIELRLFDDRERDECAERLGVKVATFDVVFSRALRAFRACWDRRATEKEDS